MDTTLLRGPACGTTPVDDGSVPSIPVKDFHARYYQKPGTVLLDVRVPAQYALCRLPGAVSIPLADWTKPPTPLQASDDDLTYFCICRRGIASHAATQRLIALGVTNVLNIRGGLDAWRSQVDPNFPEY